MADGDGQRVGGMMRLRQRLESEHGPHHPLHLRLVCTAVPADRLLDHGGRVLDAVNAGARARDEHRAPGLPTESAMRASAPTYDSSSAAAAGACCSMSSSTAS